MVSVQIDAPIESGDPEFANIHQLIMELEMPLIAGYLLDDSKKVAVELGMLFGSLLVK